MPNSSPIVSESQPTLHRLRRIATQPIVVVFVDSVALEGLVLIWKMLGTPLAALDDPGIECSALHAPLAIVQPVALAETYLDLAAASVLVPCLVAHVGGDDL